MKLTDITSGNYNAAEWKAKGYELPKFDIAAVRQKTYENPTWLHFGGGNIFRAFPAAVLNDLLNKGLYDRGVIVATTHNYSVIDKVYTPYDNLSLLVSLRADGTVEKKVVASVTEALKADEQFSDWSRLIEIFSNPSLQMVSFTITEKGYAVDDDDLHRGMHPQLAMGKVCVLLYVRFLACELPVTLQSMDNCSHNGDVVKSAVMKYANQWLSEGIVGKEFIDYLNDETKVTFPWSMIDKITPQPHAKVQELLAADGFDDHDVIQTYALGVIAETFAMIHGDRSEGLAGLDLDQLDRTADDRTAGRFTHTESRCSAVTHIDLRHRQHKFIFRFRRIDPYAMVLYVLFLIFVTAGIIRLPDLRIDGDLHATVVLLVEALTSRVFLPCGRVNHTTLHFRPVFHPVRTLLLVIRIDRTEGLLHFVPTAKFHYLRLRPVDLHIRVFADFGEYIQRTGFQL